MTTVVLTSMPTPLANYLLAHASSKAAHTISRSNYLHVHRRKECHQADMTTEDFISGPAIPVGTMIDDPRKGNNPSILLAK